MVSDAGLQLFKTIWKLGLAIMKEMVKSIVQSSGSPLSRQHSFSGVGSRERHAQGRSQHTYQYPDGTQLNKILGQPNAT